MSCPFCKSEIIEKRKLFETESEYVLYNIRKSTKGRCLVIPKRHVFSVRGLTNDEAASFFITVRFTASILYNYLKPAGLNYGINEGEIAGQTVQHLHLHILPRFEGDNLSEFHLFHGCPKTKKNLSEEDYLRLVEEFRRQFNLEK